MILTFITGLLGGAIPKLLKEFTDSRDHQREMEMLELQTDLQLQLADQQAEVAIINAESEMIAAQIKAQTAQLKAIYQGSPKTGWGWIDGLNALIRPVTALMLIGLFIFVSLIFVIEVMAQVDRGIINATALPNIVFHGVIGEAFTGVLGFLFGYRTTMSRSHRSFGKMGERFPWLR